MMDYFENRVEFESQTSAKGKNSLDRALPLADSEAIRDAKLRVEWAQLLHEINLGSKPQIKKSAAKTNASDPYIAIRKRGRPPLQKRRETDESGGEEAEGDDIESGNDEIDFSASEEINQKNKKKKDNEVEISKEVIINEETRLPLKKRGRNSSSSHDSKVVKEGTEREIVDLDDAANVPRKAGRRSSNTSQSKLTSKVIISEGKIESSDDSDGDIGEKGDNQKSGGRSSSRFTEIASKKRLENGSVDKEKNVKQSGRLQRSKAITSSESSSDEEDEDEDKSESDDEEVTKKKTTGRLKSKATQLKDVKAPQAEKGRRGRPSLKNKESTDSLDGKAANKVPLPLRRGPKRGDNEDDSSGKNMKLKVSEEQTNNDDAADEGEEDDDEEGEDGEDEEEAEVTKAAVSVKPPTTETPFERLSRLLRLLAQVTKEGAVLLDKALITFDKIEILSPTTAELKDSGAADRINILRKHPVVAIANRAKQLRTKWINSATKLSGPSSPGPGPNPGLTPVLSVETLSASVVPPHGHLISATSAGEVTKQIIEVHHTNEFALLLPCTSDAPTAVEIDADLDRLQIQSEPESEVSKMTSPDLRELEPMVHVPFDPGTVI